MKNKRPKQPPNQEEVKRAAELISQQSKFFNNDDKPNDFLDSLNIYASLPKDIISKTQFFIIA